MDSYDIIFAGGGAAACITAGRLSAADPDLKILIIEAGPHTLNSLTHVQPGRYFSHLAPGSKTVAFNVGQPSQSLLGRAPIVPSGHAVGGGSSVNFVVYTRAAASDYDDWETVYGNKGWGSKDLIPLLRKAETYQAEAINEAHGVDGPIKVSFAAEHNNVGTNFLEVSRAYDKERNHTEDINALTSCNEYGKWARYIDAETGLRSDAAHHYVYNQPTYGHNLQVVDNSHVVSVITEEDRAIGIKYVSEGADGSSQPKTVRASRLIVVAAGAFGSPAILERSGIGAKPILEKNGIPQVVDIPGVGQNYMDHNVVFPAFYGSNETHSMDHIFRGTKEQLQDSAYDKQWAKDGTGLFAQNGLDAGIKARPNAEELKSMSPEFDERWERYFANAADKPVMMMITFAGYPRKDPTVPIGKYFSMGYCSGYPASIGYVHITSGLDPKAGLNFHPGYLDNPADLVILRWAYKKTREYARRMKFYRGEVLSAHPQFPNGSGASTKPSSEPASIDAPDIVYTEADDAAIDKYHRDIVETSWHSCGTCAMKAMDQGGVVDERLNVYGIKNLKVADISIIPGNVGANTYNTAIAIGEKAAIIIAEDLGIQGV